MSPALAQAESAPRDTLGDLVPERWKSLENPRRDLPKLARDPAATARIEARLAQVPIRHDLFLADSRRAPPLAPESVHLVVTSPPYWTLKEYPDSDGQLGWVEGYEEFLDQLDKVWRRCHNALVPGGRLVCVVGDVCLSRRRHGRYTVVPLHAAIQERCRLLGFDNLAPIIWHKIANAAYEVEGGKSAFPGKPYEPNAVIKNDIEFILMQRKSGGYRRPSAAAKLLSLIPANLHKRWFRQVWEGIGGASTKHHPAPYPLELVERLIRMFSFAGDTVLDPFMGTATTQVAAAKWGRNSIGVEVESSYFEASARRLSNEAAHMFSQVEVVTHAEISEIPSKPTFLRRSISRTVHRF